MAAYRVLVGLDYAGRRAEPGDIITDLPSKSLSWLTAQGLVEKADGNSAGSEVSAPQRTPQADTQATNSPRERQSPTKKGND